MALNFADGWPVRVLIGTSMYEGRIDIKCGNRAEGDWFVILEDGRQVCVREWQIERISEPFSRD